MTDLIPNKYEELLRNLFLSILQNEGAAVALQKWNDFFPGGPQQDQAALEELLGMKPGTLAAVYGGAPTPGPSPSPQPGPAPAPSGDYNPRFWYGAVNAVADMGEAEQRQFVQACAAKRIGILLEYLAWKKGQWWTKRLALKAAMTPFFDEARKLRVPVHIYVMNTNSEPVGALSLDQLKGFVDDVVELADRTKDRILCCNEASSETDHNKRWSLTSYLFQQWQGALISYDNMDNPDDPRVVACERHPQSHTDFTAVRAQKPTFFVSDNRPMIKWLSNSDDDHAQRFDQGRVRQWRGELPNYAAGQGFYGWMHEHPDMATIATLG